MSRRAIGLLTTIAALGAALATAVPANATTTLGDPAAHRPIVIGHRGASGYRPEHTLESYRLAIKLGADVIEPDLVPTKDGVLVARHENEIGGTTNVADHPEFTGRKTTKTIDGKSFTGWFTEDFTLKELRTLRAKERLPHLRPDNTQYDGRFMVPTLQDVLNLVRKESRRLGRQIGVYAETKHPTYFRSIGLALEPPLAATLRANGMDNPDSPVLLQSFEPSSLRTLTEMVDNKVGLAINNTGKPYDFVVSGDPRTYADLVKPEGLRWIKTWGDIVNLHKNVIVPIDSAGNLLEPTSVVNDAHATGLQAFSWTFRNENQFLPLDFRDGTDPATWGDHAAEYELYFRLGVDGVFSDFPDFAVAVRDEAFPVGIREPYSVVA